MALKKYLLEMVEMVRMSKENARRTIVCCGEYVLDVSADKIVLKQGNQIIGLAEKGDDGTWKRQGFSRQETELIEMAFCRQGREKTYGKLIELNGRKTMLTKDGVFLVSPKGKAEVEDLHWRQKSAVEVMLLYLRNKVEPPRFIYEGLE